MNAILSSSLLIFDTINNILDDLLAKENNTIKTIDNDLSDLDYKNKTRNGNESRGVL